MLILDFSKNLNIEVGAVSEVVMSYISDSFKGNIIVDSKDVLKALTSMDVERTIDIARDLDDAFDLVYSDSIFVVTRHIQNLENVFDMYVYRKEVIEVDLDER